MRFSPLSFVLGLAAAALVPVISRVFRPLAVEAAAAGMGMMEDARRIVAEQMETLEDIVAEARARREHLDADAAAVVADAGEGAAGERSSCPACAGRAVRRAGAIRRAGGRRRARSAPALRGSRRACAARHARTRWPERSVACRADRVGARRGRARPGGAAGLDERAVVRARAVPRLPGAREAGLKRGAPDRPFGSRTPARALSRPVASRPA